MHLSSSDRRSSSPVNDLPESSQDNFIASPRSNTPNTQSAAAKKLDDLLKELEEFEKELPKATHSQDNSKRLPITQRPSPKNSFTLPVFPLTNQKITSQQGERTSILSSDSAPPQFRYKRADRELRATLYKQLYEQDKMRKEAQKQPKHSDATTTNTTNSPVLRQDELTVNLTHDKESPRQLRNKLAQRELRGTLFKQLQEKSNIRIAKQKQPLTPIFTKEEQPQQPILSPAQSSPSSPSGSPNTLTGNERTNQPATTTKAVFDLKDGSVNTENFRDFITSLSHAISEEIDHLKDEAAKSKETNKIKKLIQAKELRDTTKKLTELKNLFDNYEKSGEIPYTIGSLKNPNHKDFWKHQKEQVLEDFLAAKYKEKFCKPAHLNLTDHLLEGDPNTPFTGSKEDFEKLFQKVEDEFKSDIEDKTFDQLKEKGSIYQCALKNRETFAYMNGFFGRLKKLDPSARQSELGSLFSISKDAIKDEKDEVARKAKKEIDEINLGEIRHRNNQDHLSHNRLFSQAAKIAKELSKKPSRNSPEENRYKDMAVCFTQIKRSLFTAAAPAIVQAYVNKTIAEYEKKVPGFKKLQPGTAISTNTAGKFYVYFGPDQGSGQINVGFEKSALLYVDDDGDINGIDPKIFGKFKNWKEFKTGSLGIGAGGDHKFGDFVKVKYGATVQRRQGHFFECATIEQAIKLQLEYEISELGCIDRLRYRSAKSITRSNNDGKNFLADWRNWGKRFLAGDTALKRYDTPWALSEKKLRKGFGNEATQQILLGKAFNAKNEQLPTLKSFFPTIEERLKSNTSNVKATPSAISTTTTVDNDPIAKIDNAAPGALRGTTTLSVPALETLPSENKKDTLGFKQTITTFELSGQAALPGFMPNKPVAGLKATLSGAHTTQELPLERLNFAHNILDVEYTRSIGKTMDYLKGFEGVWENTHKIHLYSSVNESITKNKTFSKSKENKSTATGTTKQTDQNNHKYQPDEIYKIQNQFIRLKKIAVQFATYSNTFSHSLKEFKGASKDLKKELKDTERSNFEDICELIYGKRDALDLKKAKQDPKAFIAQAFDTISVALGATGAHLAFFMKQMQDNGYTGDKKTEIENAINACKEKARDAKKLMDSGHFNIGEDELCRHSSFHANGIVTKKGDQGTLKIEIDLSPAALAATGIFSLKEATNLIETIKHASPPPYAPDFNLGKFLTINGSWEKQTVTSHPNRPREGVFVTKKLSITTEYPHIVEPLIGRLMESVWNTNLPDHLKKSFTPKDRRTCIAKLRQELLVNNTVGAVESGAIYTEKWRTSYLKNVGEYGKQERQYQRGQPIRAYGVSGAISTRAIPQAVRAVIAPPLLFVNAKLSGSASQSLQPAHSEVRGSDTSYNMMMFKHEIGKRYDDHVGISSAQENKLMKDLSVDYKDDLPSDAKEREVVIKQRNANRDKALDFVKGLFAKEEDDDMAERLLRCPENVIGIINKYLIAVTGPANNKNEIIKDEAKTRRAIKPRNVIEDSKIKRTKPATETDAIWPLESNDQKNPVNDIDAYLRETQFDAYRPKLSVDKAFYPFSQDKFELKDKDKFDKDTEHAKELFLAQIWNPPSPKEGINTYTNLPPVLKYLDEDIQNEELQLLRQELENLKIEQVKKLNTKSEKQFLLVKEAFPEWLGKQKSYEYFESEVIYKHFRNQIDGKITSPKDVTADHKKSIREKQGIFYDAMVYTESLEDDLDARKHFYFETEIGKQLMASYLKIMSQLSRFEGRVKFGDAYKVVVAKRNENRYQEHEIISADDHPILRPPSFDTISSSSSESPVSPTTSEQTLDLDDRSSGHSDSILENTFFEEQEKHTPFTLPRAPFPPPFTLPRAPFAPPEHSGKGLSKGEDLSRFILHGKRQNQRSTQDNIVEPSFSTSSSDVKPNRHQTVLDLKRDSIRLQPGHQSIKRDTHVNKQDETPVSPMSKRSGMIFDKAGRPLHRNHSNISTGRTKQTQNPLLAAQFKSDQRWETFKDSDQKLYKWETRGDGNCAFHGLAQGIMGLIAEKNTHINEEFLIEKLNLSSLRAEMLIDAANKNDVKYFQELLSPSLRTAAVNALRSRDDLISDMSTEITPALVNEIYENCGLSERNPVFTALLDGSGNPLNKSIKTLGQSISAAIKEHANGKIIDAKHIDRFVSRNDKRLKEQIKSTVLPSYFEYMSQNGTYATSAEIGALTNLLNIKLRLFTEYPGSPPMGSDQIASTRPMRVGNLTPEDIQILKNRHVIEDTPNDPSQPTIRVRGQSREEIGAALIPGPDNRLTPQQQQEADAWNRGLANKFFAIYDRELGPEDAGSVKIGIHHNGINHYSAVSGENSYNLNAN